MRIRWGRIMLVMLIVLFACGGIALLAGYLPSEIGDGPASPGAQFTSRPTAPSDRAASRADDLANAPARTAAPAERPRDDGALPAFRVLTLQYAPYMATLAHMDAGGYLEARGYDLQLVDVYSDDVGLDEEGQCQAIRSGEYDALATTLDATRKCGDGAAVGIPIGQSAGNDAIVVKPGVTTWSEIFDHAIAFTGYSVSEYMACFASHTAAAPLQFPLRYDDAAAAVDAWIDSGVEQDISAVVAWEPEIDRALAAVPGSAVILSSRDVRILWDVVEFSTARSSAEPEAFQAFTAAYYEALADLARDSDGAYGRLAEWAGADEGRQSLMTAGSADELREQLGLEAFGTLRDAALLMDDGRTLTSRLEEAGFYWNYCGQPVPPVQDLRTLLAPEFVLAAKTDAGLQQALDARPGDLIFQVTDFTNKDAVNDDAIAQAQKLFETGVDIEFEPNRTDFRNPAKAQQTLEDAVRFLRTCQDCFLEIQGSAAYPGGAFRRSFTEADADVLAIDRGRRVFDELSQRFDVPDAQLLFLETSRARKFPGSVIEDELRLDRRTYLTGYKLAGGM